MSKKLYLFDFDGTLTYKDSFKDFFCTMYGIKKIAWLLLLGIGKISKAIVIKRDKGKIKEAIIAVLCKGKTKEELQLLGKTYSEQKLHKIIRPKALAYLKKLKNEHAEMYLVSASVDIWLQNFADEFHLKLISTQLAYCANGAFAGHFLGKNCKGAEKVYRIQQEIDITAYDEIIAFGDSSGDSEMLAIATQAYYKPFRSAHAL